MSDEETKKETVEKGKQTKEKKAVRRISISESYDNSQPSIPMLIITCVSAIIVMMMICAGVFFANIKGAEQVLVPNVVGKTLEDGIIELQIKELYPKVNFRYTEEVTAKGVVLEQSPAAGSIIKGFNTVTLTVSRYEEEIVPDYEGESYEALQNAEEQAANAEEEGKKKALISLGKASYIMNNAPAGTIIAQLPVAGTKVFNPTEVQFVVSKGSSVESYDVPELIGKTVDDVLSCMNEGTIIYDVTYRAPTESEVSGTVVKQSATGSKGKYSRISIEMALDDSLDNEIVSGVFKKTLCEYPVPVNMSVEGVTPEGTKFNVANFKHVGGEITIPYSVPRGSVLTLYVLDDVKAETVIG